MPRFDFYNVKIEKAEGSNDLIIKGEITNRSGRSYNAVAIRAILFVKNIQIVNAVVVVNGLLVGQTKRFEKTIEELEYDKVYKDITRYEMYIESAY
jgi:hypothetical protein